MNERKTLLQKYEIPLNHLDFQYIKDCNDSREMERIVHILQSGEEGYFPDLTKCAEEKLRALKPNSRLFRYEDQILRREDVGSADVKPIYEFSNKVRQRDQRLTALKNSDENLPPLRTPGIIKFNSESNKKSSQASPSAKTNETTSSSNINSNRIKSTDYNKWDKYDPEEEILRMDLEEERQQEEIERLNRLNINKSEKIPLITEITEEEERARKLTDVERENLSEEYRLRGNEYFRAKEYDLALAEYTRGISINPNSEAPIYNNRAQTYIKLKKFPDAIQDCEKCLSLEPNNKKALYRLAESNLQIGCKQKALEMFSKVLELDPNNINAKNFINSLTSEIGELPPPNATRLRIQEEPKQCKKDIKSQSATNVKKTTKCGRNEPVPKTTNSNIEKSTMKDYDLASLVRPKEIIPNKLMDATSNLLAQHNPPQKVDVNLSVMDGGKSDNKNKSKDMEIRLPMMNDTGNIKRNKPLIEEI